MVGSRHSSSTYHPYLVHGYYTQVLGLRIIKKNNKITLDRRTPKGKMPPNAEKIASCNND
jgi:hypothetical protein